MGEFVLVIFVFFLDLNWWRIIIITWLVKTYLVNYNVQFLIGLEGSIRTTDVSICMATTTLSTWMPNSYRMTVKFLGLDRKRTIATALSV